MKISWFLIILPCVALVTLLIIWLFPFGGKKKAALQVISSPKTTIFFDGEHLGQSPYFDEELKPGEYTVKLVPEGEDSNLTWQTTIKLTPGVLTVINRNFGKTDEDSNGYVLSLEPIPQKDKTRVSIVSVPDSAVVTIDGEPKGFTPLSLEDVSEGEHILNILTPGYEGKEIKAKIVKGYKLVANVQLGRELGKEEQKEEEKKVENKEASPSAEGKDKETVAKDATSAAVLERPYVKIKETPTGWLNVRSEPSTAAKEETVVAKVYPGETYKFIEANDAGWYKIEYKADKEGWITGKYAELFR